MTLSALILSEAVAFDALILGLELCGETVAIVLWIRLDTSRTRDLWGLIDLLLMLDKRGRRGGLWDVDGKARI